MSSPPDRFEQEEYPLADVLYIGPSRARLLAAIGIHTLDDLRAADAVQIGSVKGVGLRNGERIKEWLALRDAARVPAMCNDNPDPELAHENQSVQDDMAAIDQAITRIQQAIPRNVAHKKFDRQVERLLAVMSELAEGPDTLRPKQQRKAVKMLHLIATLLDTLTTVGPLSEKKVLAFAEELRDRRRRLQDILDPKS